MVTLNLGVRVAWWLPAFIWAARLCAWMVYACGGRVDEDSRFFRFLAFVMRTAVAMPVSHD
jgi:hypothetical protein